MPIVESEQSFTEATTPAQIVTDTTTPAQVSTDATTELLTSVVTQSPTNPAESATPVTVIVTTTSDRPVETPSLTTFFTPPADCTDGKWTSSQTSFGTLTCTRAYTSSCFPPSFTDLRYVGVYSPGACPYGYNIGDAYIDTRLAGTTSRVCCPGQVCTKLAHSSTPLTNCRCIEA
jgi:hypothetical protein